MSKSTIRLLLLGAGLILLGCSRSGLGSRQVVCSQSATRAYSSVDQVPSGEWLQLILNEDQRRHDCAGNTFDPVELPLRCAKAARPGTARPLPIREEALHVMVLPGGFGILYMPVEEFTNGDKILLLAHIHASKKALSVVSIGAVRLPPDDLKFELREMLGEELLFAEGGDCLGGAAVGRCDRTLKLLLSYEGRFVPLELRDSDNQCDGETAIDLVRTQEVRLDSGWRRRFELVSMYEIKQDGLVIHEQLLAMDRPPNGDEDNARLFRQSDAKRQLDFTGAYFVSDRESLWQGMREVRGDLQSDPRSGAFD